MLQGIYKGWTLLSHLQAFVLRLTALLVVGWLLVLSRVVIVDLCSFCCSHHVDRCLVSLQNVLLGYLNGKEGTLISFSIFAQFSSPA